MAEGLRTRTTNHKLDELFTKLDTISTQQNQFQESETILIHNFLHWIQGMLRPLCHALSSFFHLLQCKKQDFITHKLIFHIIYLKWKYLVLMVLIQWAGFQDQQFFNFPNIPGEQRIAIASFYMDDAVLNCFQWMHNNGKQFVETSITCDTNQVCPITVC